MDETQRRAERKQSLGDRDASVATLIAALRSGEVERRKVIAAAVLGHPAAKEATANRQEIQRESLVSDIEDAEDLLEFRSLLAFAAHCLKRASQECGGPPSCQDALAEFGRVVNDPSILGSARAQEIAESLLDQMSNDEGVDKARFDLGRCLVTLLGAFAFFAEAELLDYVPDSELAARDAIRAAVSKVLLCFQNPTEAAQWQARRLCEDLLPGWEW